MSELLCRSRFIYEGRLWRCRMPATETEDACVGRSHMCDTPVKGDGRDDTLTWENADQVPAELVAVIEQAEKIAPAFDWQLYLSHDETTNRRVVEVIGTSRAPGADVDAAAAAVFPAGRVLSSFKDEGYAIVFGDAHLTSGEKFAVQVTTEIPGHTGRPWDPQNEEVSA